MDNIKIRTVSINDADDICKISSKYLGYLCEPSLVREKIGNLDPDREAVFVAMKDGNAVGYIHVEKYDLLYFETMANILGLAVKSEYQHNGIGKALVFAAEAWAAENGIKSMRLNSGASRAAAHEFYKHLGYESDKGQLRFTKNLSL